MRIVKVSLAIALMLFLSAGVSQAAFDNSHHDMRAYNSKTEGCYHCHGINDASVPQSVSDNAVGRIGALCLARCHVGGIALPAGIAKPTLTPTTGPGLANQTDYTTTTVADITVTYFSNSHDRNPANLTNPGFATSPVATWPPGGTANTWPYVASATTIQCTSCHAVHDNKNAPFLWAPLAPLAANGVDGFCDTCHLETGRRGSIAAAPAGNHVVNVAADNSATGSAGRTGNTRHARRIVIQGYGATGTTRVFDVANAAGTALVNGPNAASAWNMGGHMITPAAASTQQGAAMTAWTSGASTQVVGCFTCHAAHRTAPQGENNLTVLPVMNNNAGVTTYNPLCVGCHGLATTYAADTTEFDIGTTGWGHPVGANTGYTTAPNIYTSSVGGFTFVVNQTPGFTNIENGNQYGSAGRVLCTTCHKVHGGNRMALANLGQTAGSTGICKRCHNGLGIQNLNDFSKGSTTTTGSNAINQHHVTTPTHTAWTLPGAITPTAETDLLYINLPSWSTAGGLGDITTSMDCADCHVFNQTAHNW